MTTQKRTISEFAEPGMGGPEQGIPAPAADNQQVIGVEDGGIDREGAMAKADLYKLASYSHKLYEKIGEEDQLEAWVQAKITKAADYIASVYHYLEYEMKFSEYGHHLDNSDTLSESQKTVLKNKLNEARAMVKQLKLAQVEKVSESGDYGWDESPKEKKAREAKEKAEENKPKTSSTGGTITKTKTGLRHTAKQVDESGDYGWDESPKEKKAREAKEKADADKPTKSSTGGTITKTKTGLRHTAKGSDEKVDESKPSADLTKKEKSATVKKAKKGGDIGKPGKGFKKVAAKAAKEYGSKEKGEKVAAAAMWKNIKKEAVETLSEKAKPDYIDLDKDGDKKEPMKKAAKEAGAKKATVKESTDFTRMQDQLSRLNRSENHQIVESSEADKLRALTKLLG